MAETIEPQPATARAPELFERLFCISERGSTLTREIRGGVVTFFTMAYIVVLNPLIIGTVPDGTGAFLGGGDAPDLAAVAAATALVAGVMSLLMGLVANSHSRSRPASASTPSSPSASPHCQASAGRTPWAWW